MQAFLSLGLVLIYALWFHLSGRAMIATGDWRDFAVGSVLAATSFFFGWAVIWDMAIQFPTHYLAGLLMPLIKLVYGNWL